MKRVLNRFTDTSSSNTTIILVSITLLFSLATYTFFQNYKENLIKERIDSYVLNINYLNTKLENSILSLNKSQIESEVEKAFSTNLFASIKMDKKRFIFDKNSLLNSTNSSENSFWEIAEVVVDARYGTVIKLPNSTLYEFIPSNLYDVSQDIQMRYQVYKENEIKNIVTSLNFSKIKAFEASKKQEDKFFTSRLVDTINLNKTYEIKIQDYLISSISYTVNIYSIEKEIQSFFIKLLVFFLIMFLPLFFILGFYHDYLFNKYVTKPVIYLNEYLENVLNDRFIALDKSNFEDTGEIKDLTKKISKISSKIASLKNEINLNKESLELKSSTDSLTGLPNKSIFDLDIKSMFVSSTEGYVFIIKIDKLSELSSSHDSGYINNFVETYVNIVKNVAFAYSKMNMKVYRFYGSQFAIIAKKFDAQKAEEMCEKIISQLLDIMPDIYDIPDDLIQIGGTAFDLYGSLESIMASANKAYDVSKAKGPNSFHIIKENEIEKNYSLLDNNVLDVLDRADFELDFVLDSFSFDEPEKVLMKEVSPQIYDKENKKISIGSFVAIAQKLGLASKFDKMVIAKVIAYIRGHEIDHELAINLSISSLEDEEFLTWLDEVLSQNTSILENIVFSITSYTAYLHKNTFIDFIKRAHKNGTKVILKRYKTDEYPLDKLESLNIDYIRMNKDYTVNFSTDLVKKHKVKNILIFAELNDIKVFADSVKLDSDYDLLERLGTHGTSR